MSDKVFVYSADSIVRGFFRDAEFEPRFFTCPDKLCSSTMRARPSVIVLDYRLLVRIGPEHIQRICRTARYSTIIMLAQENLPHLIPFFWECGIKKYVMLPCSRAGFMRTILPMLDAAEAFGPEEDCGEEFLRGPELDGIVGRSPGMLRLKRQLLNIARTDTPMLLLGESGTGKTHMAKAVHRLSRRKEMPFFSINMAAIPEQLAEAELFGTEAGAFTGSVSRGGYFNAAEGGTMFMDEIGELPPTVQSKLLHVLEDGCFSKVGSTRRHKCDVRFLFATNSDLGRMVEDRRFRQDLYYRISIFPVVIPPLRERREDIPVLAEHFLESCGKTMTESAVRKLCDHRWPGNIRELRNCLTRASLITGGRTIRDRDISF